MRFRAANYYGVKYYNPKLSVPALSPVGGWLSVDALVGKFPSLSPRWRGFTIRAEANMKSINLVHESQAQVS